MVWAVQRVDGHDRITLHQARTAAPSPGFVAGLLAPLPTKNCWTIAEHAGDDGPAGMQDLIGRASWDDALVRADVRDFVTARLGHPDGVLLVDETGDLTKGTRTVGVQRQYSGTAGKIENC
jgi:SRSO17 transposase